jgi:hypothetical protein
MEAMMVFRTGLLMLVALAGLMLTGCLESRMPLFDEAKAVTPAPAGRYQEQERRTNGSWLDRLSGTLTIEGKSYSWKPDDKEGIDFFTLHDIGGGFYVAAARAKNPQPKDPYTYALFEATKDGFLSYAPTCGDLTKMRLPKEDMPTVDGSDCFFTDRDKLVRALQFYAKYILPASRYVPVKP